MQLNMHFFSLLGSLLAILVVVAEAAPQDDRTGKPIKGRSVIQLISDGFGPASETFARDFMQARDGKPWDSVLTLDNHLVGTIRTRSTDSLVTDSAASATAYSCGVKSVNAYIGVDVDKKPCGTILEAAKAKGLKTALVTTSRITHATPASYSAHIDDRENENEIASQQIGNYLLGPQADILWGGGLRHFLPKNATGSSRKDDRDLLAEAKKNKYTVTLDRAGFDAFKNGQNVTLPSLALFTKSHMAYEVDRDPKLEPSLTEMAIAALNTLKKTGKEFFLMVEGARIDHAAHNNDPIGHVYDILEYNRLFAAVSKWIDENDKDGEMLLISTSDHECGGLTLADQRPEDAEGAYLWYPDVLFKAKHSTEFLAAQFLKTQANATDAAKRDYLATTIIRENLGVDDASPEEIDRALELSKRPDQGLAFTYWLSSLLNWRAQLGWATTGHSGIDVNLYMYQKDSKKVADLTKTFIHNHENTWIGEFTAQHLGLTSLQKSITDKLNNGSWTAGQGSANKSTVIPRYHGGVARIIPPLTQPRPYRRDIMEGGYSHEENNMIRRKMKADVAEQRRAVDRRAEL